MAKLVSKLKDRLRKHPKTHAVLKRSKDALAERRRRLVHPVYYARITKHQLAYARIRRLAKKQVTRGNETHIAVVVHVYHADIWPVIEGSLGNLGAHKHDLFISYPAHNRAFVNQIKATYKSGTIYAYEVPNWGRDVLAFMQLAPILKLKGYRYVLKLHTKRSPHRTDGSSWMADMVSSLLPSDTSTRRLLFEKLEDRNTGLLGPAGEYYSLKVNFEANGPHMTRFLSGVYGRQTAYDVLQANRLQHGFFAGSMFWARLDSLAPVIDQPRRLWSYEVELGQIDATRAHALERLFSLVQEIEKRKLYEINANKIREVAYDSGIVPDWTDIYIGPKS